MVLTPFHGFCMALADSVPGVSGGTVAFILGFYDRFINALHDLLGRDNAARKTALAYLLKLGVGWIVGMGLCVSLLAGLFADHIIQQSIPKKPTVSIIHLNFPVSLPQRRYPKQMLNEYHLDKHNRICAGTAIVMAVVRVQPFIQPLIIHDLFYFPQQMLLWHQRLQIYDDWLMPCIFSPAFHENTPVSSIIAETGAFG